MLQEQILSYLEKNKGQQVTGGELAREFQVSRTAVWKSIHALCENGHRIQSFSKSGYVLLSESDGLSKTSIQSNLTTKTFGQHLELLKTIPSTNQYLKELAIHDLPEGYAVLANEQTQGRGRLNRTFHSPSNEGIYLSILVKPQIALSETPFLTICTAVAVSQAIEKICGFTAGIKWVNDLYYDNKKLCGILTEGFVSAELQIIDYAIVGIGINTGHVVPEVQDIATSIYDVTHILGIRNQLIAEILNQFEKIYVQFTQQDKKQDILQEYVDKLFIMNRKIQVITSDKPYEAIVTGVDISGALIVRNIAGETIHINSGSINL